MMVTKSARRKFLQIRVLAVKCEGQQGAFYITREKCPSLLLYCCKAASSPESGLEWDVAPVRLLIAVVVEGGNGRTVTELCCAQTRVTNIQTVIIQPSTRDSSLYASTAMALSAFAFSSSRLRAVYSFGCVTHSPPPMPSPFLIPWLSSKTRVQATW